MALEKDFFDCSTGQIILQPLSTMTDYGAPQYSTDPQTFFAYEETGTRLVVTPDANQEISSSTIYVLSSSAQIGTQDLLTLADGRQPRILRSDVVNDEQGQHHLEVSIQ